MYINYPVFVKNGYKIYGLLKLKMPADVEKNLTLNVG